MNTPTKPTLTLVLHQEDGGSEELTITAPDALPTGDDQGADTKERVMAAIVASQTATLGGSDQGAVVALDSDGDIWVARYGSGGPGAGEYTWAAVGASFSATAISVDGGPDSAILAAIDTDGRVWLGRGFTRHAGDNAGSFLVDWTLHTAVFTAATITITGAHHGGLMIVVDDAGGVWSSRYTSAGAPWTAVTLPEAA